jgi:hypothetical protein
VLKEFKMKKLRIAAIALLSCAMVAPAWADHVRFGVVVGGPYWGPPYYYNPPVYYNYSPPVIVNQPAPVYVEREAAPADQAEARMWYYCKNPKGYYPYVKRCPAGWQKVPATPEDSSGVPPQ